MIKKKFSKIIGIVLGIIGRSLYIVAAAILFLMFSASRQIWKLTESGSFWKTIGIILLVILILSIIVYVGRVLTILGKKIIAKSINFDLIKELDNPNFHPVLYLRTFNEDKRTLKTSSLTFMNYEIEMLSTEEEQLSKAISDIGPMVAIGIPGEKLPTLGAGRFYSDDDSWKQLVNKILLKSKLVILKIGNTDGFRWEVGHTLENARPEQVVILIPNNKTLYDDFCFHLSKFIHYEFPEFVYGYNNFTMQSLMYFTDHWEPHLIKLKSFYNRKSKLSPLKSVIRLALKPVYNQIGVKWKRQPISSSYIILGIFMSLAIGFDAMLPFTMSYNSEDEMVIAFVVMYSILLVLSLFMALCIIGFRKQLNMYKKYERTLSDKELKNNELLNKLENILELYFAHNLNKTNTEKFYNPGSMSIDEMYNARITDFYEVSFKSNHDINQLINQINKYSAMRGGTIISDNDIENIVIVFYMLHFSKVYIINIQIAQVVEQDVMVKISALMKKKGAKQVAEDLSNYLIGSTKQSIKNA